MAGVRLILNIIWLVFSGLWLAIGYALAGVIMLLPVITIPFAIAAFRLASFVIWPFGRTVVPKESAGAASLVGNVLWFILAGVWIALGHLVTSVALALTIIGIPLAVANVKLALVALAPLGKDIVDIHDPRATSVW